MSNFHAVVFSCVRKAHNRQFIIIKRMDYFLILFSLYIFLLIFFNKIWKNGPEINLLKLLKNLLKKPSGNEIAGVDFLRLFSMQWIIFGHTSGDTVFWIKVIGKMFFFVFSLYTYRPWRQTCLNFGGSKSQWRTAVEFVRKSCRWLVAAEIGNINSRAFAIETSL